MVFSSVIFLFVFLPVVLLLYYISTPRYRNLFLLLASLLFYAWGEPKYVILMVLSICVNWILGIVISGIKHQRRRSISLGLGISFNLLVLLYYKYAGFLIENINLVLANTKHSIAFEAPMLPVGISFMVFHSISYLVDIYKNQARPISNPINMGVYISMFPQLVAGPIVRFHDIADQIMKRTSSVNKFASGIERFIFGLGKKVLIANVLGQVSDDVFSLEPIDLSCKAAWLGISCYTLQIYFDFSGYSDMAIGLGRMFGFEFLENFNYPYISRTMREFWQRWHLSLSTWFRDYLYIPLGGNRVSSWRINLNLFIVFLLCGLWHGASWNFILWGILHGTLLIIERGSYGKWLNKMPNILAYGYVMLCVMIGWVFFKAHTLNYALSYLLALFGFAQTSAMPIQIAIQLNSYLVITLLLGITLSTPIFTCAARDWKERLFPPHINMQPGSIIGDYFNQKFGEQFLIFMRPIIILAIFILCSMSLAAGVYNPFIYFRF